MVAVLKDVAEVLVIKMADLAMEARQRVMANLGPSDTLYT